MKREDLTKLGLTDDATIDAIMAAHGKDIEKFKTTAETAQAEVTGLKTQLTEAGAAIEGFKKLDIEGVKKSADEWKAKAETTATEAQKQLASLKFEHALDGSLASAKAKNPRAVKALLDPAALKYNETDGSIVGLKEQLEKVKSENDYLFEGEQTSVPRIVSGTNPQPTTGDAIVNAARQAAGLPAAK